MYIPMVITLIKLFVQILHKEVTSDMWWGVESRGKRDLFSPDPGRQEWQITGLTSANQVTYYSTVLLRDSSSTKASKYFPGRQKFQGTASVCCDTYKPKSARIFTQGTEVNALLAFAVFDECYLPFCLSYVWILSLPQRFSCVFPNAVIDLEDEWLSLVTNAISA